MTDLKEIELPAEHKEKVKIAIERTHIVDRALQRMELSGKDVTTMRNKNVADRESLIKLKAAWFPNE